MITLQYNDEDEADPGRVLGAAAAAQQKKEKKILSDGLYHLVLTDLLD